MSIRERYHADWAHVATNDAANLIALPWWAWCLVPHSHPVFARSHSFDAMQRIAGQSVWGAVVVALWLALLIALLSEHPGLRVAVLIACAMFWALAASMLFVSNPTATGVGPYAAFSVLSAWRSARLMGGG